VRVPLGSRAAIGVCVGLLPLERGSVAPDKLKPIERALDAADLPSLPPAVLELCRFAADYYRAGLGEVVEAALPPGVKKRVRARARPAEGAGEVAQAPEVGSASAAGDTPSALDAPAAGPAPAPPPELTPAQRRALAPILDDLAARRFGVTLVHGVTGSGKTELYQRACAETLAQGRQALVLVPEIALTPQTVRRFEARLGKVALLHSMQGQAERARQWERARRGEAAVVIGPRSAVFAPLTRLGLVVVDEEHDPGFKQQEPPPRYSARDLAVVRAQREGAACVLGSATPSLESLDNAARGRYRKVTLAERPGGATLPRVEVVDLREEQKAVKGFPFLGRALVDHMRRALDRKEQVILFLNRRGFSTFITCPVCGHVAGCGSCDVALTYHKARGRAVCHGCDAVKAPPTACAACGHAQMSYFGFGTERVQEEVERRFPDVVCRRLDSDAIDGAEELERVLQGFGRGDWQVLIGTQMVAKGLDFPNVSVVGVISADTGLNLPDFRAAERTFQLCAQVAGRAGRGQRPGVTVIQTFAPGHPAIRFATGHDADGFAEDELRHRRRLGYPPFGRLCRVVVSSQDEARAETAAEEVAAQLRVAQERAGIPPARLRLLGPAACPISQVRGWHRVMVLLKAADRAALAPLLDALDDLPRRDRALRVAVDIDPTSML
jgi:primosomal protein N' (replication factor Y)